MADRNASTFFRPLTLLAAFLVLGTAPALRADDDDKYGESVANLLAAHGPAACVDGFAEGFPCQGVDLLAALPLSKVGGVTFGADMWGWVDPVTRREYVVYAHALGTAFVDITAPTKPVYLGLLPVPDPEEPRTHGDIKVYRGYAYIVGERTEAHHGLLVFDLRRLRGLTHPPVTFTPDAHYQGFDRCHNLAMNEESGFLYAVSTTTCNDGLHMIDVRDPGHPRFAGCADVEAGTHDAQCVNYRGPDADYAGREICFVSGGDAFAILDVTDKSLIRLVSRSTYDGLGYVHQGWLTEDQAFFLLGDEADESQTGHNTRTYVFDVRDLDAPSLAGFHDAETAAIDHNLYVRGDYVYEANYNAGLRVLHLDDPSRAALTEVAYFDTVPGVDEASFASAWTAYPYFPSGTVAVSALDGLYLLRPTFAGARRGCDLAVSDPDYCKVCGPCSQGEGRCVTDDECLPGLACSEDFGVAFGFGPTLDVCTAPGSVTPSYSAVELPAVDAGGNLLDVVAGRGINNAGQVVGFASNDDPDVVRSVAFRFDPVTGMKVIDAAGGQRSRGALINEKGDVFGVVLIRGTTDQRGLFVYRDGQGINRLKRGANPAIERHFFASDINEYGDVAGGMLIPAEGRLVPFLFTFEDGWQALEGVDAAFQQASTVAYLINNRGDVVFSADDSKGGLLTYLWRGGPAINLGGHFNIPTDLNDRGDVTGLTSDIEGHGHAYLYQGERSRFFDLHPRVFSESSALVVTRKGVVGGEMASETGTDTLFTYDQRRQKVRQVVARKDDFQSLLPTGTTFERILTFYVNERLEFVGAVRGANASGGPVERWFYSSQPTGVLDLQELAVDAGSPRTIDFILGLNDRGAILVGYEDGGKERALVLVPDGF